MPVRWIIRCLPKRRDSHPMSQCKLQGLIRDYIGLAAARQQTLGLGPGKFPHDSLLARGNAGLLSMFPQLAGGLVFAHCDQ